MGSAPGGDSRAIAPRLRVAHVITGLELGGGGAVVLTIARALDRSRFQMDVFCVLEGGAGEQELRQLGCSVTILEGAWDYRRRFVPYSPSKLLALAAALRTGRYDIVHTHLFPADAIGRLAGRLAGIPVLIRSLHNMGRWKKRRHIWTDRLLNRWTDRVICCSDFQRQTATAQEGFAPDQAITIHHGVRLARFRPSIDRAALARELDIDGTRLIVGTVGRPIEEKGHIYLIDAIPSILDRHPGTQFLIVGDGGLRPSLEARVKMSGLADHVRFVGARADVAEMLAMMDVFVFPSVSEGFGIAVVEAMASRLPIVASNIRPLSEIVVDRQTGLLVPPANRQVLAAAVSELLGDEPLRARFGRAGYERVEGSFTDRHMVATYENVYLDLHRAKCRRRGVGQPIPCQQ